MKLSISNIAWAKEQDEQVYSRMREYGYSALEIAPTRIFPEAPYDHLEEASSWARKLKEEEGFDVSSMQSIWYGRQENIFRSKEDRDTLIEYTKKAVDFAAAVGCKNLVFGCPKNRTYTEGDDLKDAVSFFKAIAEYALKKGTVIAMEANPPIYNTNYINDTASALRLIQEVDSESFLLNLDMGTMIENEEDISILKGNVRYINHVHISEPYLKAIEKRELHKELFKVLQEEDYSNYISIEMGKQEDLSVIEKTLAYVREIFG
ncbi:MAG: sugar phosphate isomerase/epimerase [Erysipelotrichaceae bacterium]|nr:sugar phosphate isomerase/epimerase [Erysipelotrichaceae bacterium]